MQQKPREPSTQDIVTAKNANAYTYAVKRILICRNNIYLLADVAAREGRTKPVEEDNADEALAVLCGCIIDEKVKPNNNKLDCKQNLVP